LVKAYAKGARAAGIIVQKVPLRRLTIADCKGCYQCRDKGGCSIDDDMTGLRGSLERADVLVLASPLYFCGVSGLMRMFLDRLYFFYHKRNKIRLTGKKALSLIVFGEKETGHETALVEEFFSRYFHALGLVQLDMVFFPDLMEKNAILEHPEAIDRAYFAGRSLRIALRKLDIKSEIEMLKLKFGVPRKEKMKG
jgi:multimeric flavodoxin WrbA